MVDMEQAIMIGIDLIAIAVMTFGLYFPRHRRRDLVVAYLVVNVGVLAVSAILGTTTVGLGVGLGLFGVLSIIRLRSSEISQHELAYYFAALAVGLLTGLSTTINPVVIALVVLVVAVIAIGDSPALFRRYRQQTIVMDTAYTNEAVLRTELERMLGAKVHRVNVLHLDTVNDTTTVEARFQLLDTADVSRTHESLVR
jgi:sensor histidine kinase YesM